MTPAALLTDMFERVVEGGERVLDGLSEEQLTHRVGPEANTIAWLLWHLTRVQDHQVADVAGREQVWTSQGYAERFALPLPVDDTGFGHRSDEVAAVRAPAELLADYLRATHEQTIAYLDTLTEEDLDRIVDTNWDPPVTLGVRLVSTADDDAQHLGQAAYIRGLLEG